MTYSYFTYPSNMHITVSADRDIFEDYMEDSPVIAKSNNKFAALGTPPVNEVISNFRKYCSDCDLSTDSIDDDTIADWLSD